MERSYARWITSVEAAWLFSSKNTAGQPMPGEASMSVLRFLILAWSKGEWQDPTELKLTAI